MTNKLCTTQYKKLSLAILFVVLCAFPIIRVHAAPPQPAQPPCDPKLGYCVLAQIPNVSTTAGNVNIDTYIPDIVKLIIGLAGGLAVIRIIIGGIQLMTTEAFTGRSEAKKVINDALIGLLLAMSAYVILHTLNPDLVNFNFSVQGLRAGQTISTSGNSLTCPGGDSPPNGDIKQCTGAQIGAKCKVADANNVVSVIPCVCLNCMYVTNKLLPFKTDVNPTMNAGLYKALLDAASNPDLDLLNIFTQWYITEAWPPTAAHSSICHTNGSCVDVNTVPGYQGGTIPSKSMVRSINDLYNNLTKEGELGAIFEASPSDAIKLKAAGVTVPIESYKTTTAPSFHVTLNKPNE